MLLCDFLDFEFNGRVVNNWCVGVVAVEAADLQGPFEISVRILALSSSATFRLDGTPKSWGV